MRHEMALAMILCGGLASALGCAGDGTSEQHDPPRSAPELGELGRLFESPEDLEAFQRAHVEADAPPTDADTLIEGRTEKIINGTTLNQAYTGALVMWYYNTQYNEVRQTCGGTLYMSNLAITAAHCLDPDSEKGITDGWVANARIMSTWTGSGWASSFVSATYKVPGYDLALLSLANTIPVQLPDRLETQFYGRSFAEPDYGGLHYVIAYGARSYPNQIESTLCATHTEGCVADPRPQQRMYGAIVEASPVSFVFLDSSAGYAITHGDSGSAVQLLQTGNPAVDPVVGIVIKTGLWSTPSGTQSGALVISLLDI